MLNGAKLAYKAVMRPVEGTILTVVRESTDNAKKYLDENDVQNLEEYIDILCKEARASLEHTPELLPILKEARVVDSGGSGLVAILDGFKAYLEGHPIEESDGSNTAQSFTKSGYNTEFILRLSDRVLYLIKKIVSVLL